MANCFPYVSCSFRISLKSGLQHAVDFCREHKIALGQSIGLVRKNSDFNLAPRKEDVRMVAFFFRDSPHAIHEIEAIFKVRKGKTLRQMVLTDYVPTLQLAQQPFDISAFQRRNAALQGTHF